MQRLALVVLFGLSLLLSACGGGGGGSSGAATAASTTTSPTGTTTTSAPPAASSPAPQPAVANQLPVAMTPGNVNVPVVSVTVCAPGTSTCQTIPNIIVDTGSSGLRVAASAFNATMQAALPAELSQTLGTSGQVAECATFGIGATWGGIHKADIKLAGELAASVPVQIVGDTSVPAAPSACSGANALGSANGLIGISVFKQDCGPYCVQTQANNVYYVCNAGTCTSQAMSLSQQVVNPVSAFAQDNNGTLITMPSIPAAGAAQANGVLTFGIATQTDNIPPGSPQFYAADPTTGYFKTAYKGQTLNSFLDTGSNLLYFADSSIALCTQYGGFYCPPTALNLNAQITSSTGASSSTIAFTLENAQQVFNANPSYLAFPGIGANPATGSFLASMFDWGFPFYFGRTVGTLIEGATSPYGVGPGTLF